MIQVTRYHWWSLYTNTGRYPNNRVTVFEDVEMVVAP